MPSLELEVRGSNSPLRAASHHLAHYTWKRGPKGKEGRGREAHPDWGIPGSKAECGWAVWTHSPSGQVPSAPAQLGLMWQDGLVSLPGLRAKGQWPQESR